jgi:hypothetical protein
MRRSKSTFLMGLLVLALPASAQESPRPFRYWGNAHGEMNLGVCAHGYRFTGAGGGVEASLVKGLTVGARASGNAFSDSDGFGVFHGELGYHGVDRARTTGADPFVSGGIGVMSGDFGRTGASFSVGGGMNYWFNRHVALRIEGRMITFTSDAVFVAQVGMSFR